MQKETSLEMTPQFSEQGWIDGVGEREWGTFVGKKSPHQSTEGWSTDLPWKSLIPYMGFNRF